MKTQAYTQSEATVAMTVAGEDIVCGDYVAVLNETFEYPSFLWDACGASLSPHELVRLRYVSSTAGCPMRVIAICLPFVYVKTTTGEAVTIDTRRAQLVRLHRKSAKVIWKAMRRSHKKMDRRK